LTRRGERNVERDALFSVFLCFLPSLEIVKGSARKSGTRCTQKSLEARVHKCMSSVILQFSSADAKSLRSFWFWKRSQEPLLGSFLTSINIFRNKIRKWFLAFLQLFLGLQSFWQYKIFECAKNQGLLKCRFWPQGDITGRDQQPETTSGGRRAGEPEPQALLHGTGRGRHHTMGSRPGGSHIWPW
jgi:hypothetical protein